MTDDAGTPVPADRTARLQPDGTIGSGRPAAPEGVRRPPPAAPGWGGQAPRPSDPAAPEDAQPPRRRARDEDTPPPLPAEQLPSGEFARPAPPTPEPEVPAADLPRRPGPPTAGPAGVDVEPVHAESDEAESDEAQPDEGEPAEPVSGEPEPDEAEPVDADADADRSEHQDDVQDDEVRDRQPTATAVRQDHDDDPSDLEQTLVAHGAVVPPDVFDDRPATPGQSVATAEDDAPTLTPADRIPPLADDGPRPAAPDTGPPAPGGPPVLPTDRPARSAWRRPVVLVPLGILVVLGVAYGADLAIAGDDVPRGTVVAGVDLGGLSRTAAADTLGQQLAPRVIADHVLRADDVEGTLSPAAAGISLDVDATVADAAEQPLNPWTRVVSLFTDREVAPTITGDDTALAAQVDAFAESVDRAPSDATIAIEGTDATVVPPVDGRTLDRDAAAEAVTRALAAGGDPETPIDLPVETAAVRVDEAAARQALDDTVTPALSAPVTVAGDDGTTAQLDVEGIAAALVFTPSDDGSLDVALDPAGLQTALGDQLGAFGTPAEDARFEVSGGTISVVPSVDGTGIDPAALAEAVLPVLTDPAPRQVTASLGPVPAAFTTEDAGALGISEQISTFSTNFTSSASGTNIRVAAEEVDGALVLPGETFSLNGYTGPRTEAQGYVPAGIISNGEFTQGVGGGVSQFATTMFNAVFFAGLEDVYHKPHSYYISRYPAGREATVFYDSIDLQWRNDSPTGVYVQTEWVPGTLTVTFWGTRRFDVQSVSSERYNVRSPVVQEKPDDGDCSPQGGSNGFDITVTRIFTDPTTAQQVRTEDFQTRYAAEPVIRCVPVAAPAPGATAPGMPAQPTGRRPPRVRRVAGVG